MGLHFYLKKDKEIVFRVHITHNLIKMAKAAGIYEVLWQPHQIKSGASAGDLLKLLSEGLLSLEDKPKRYEIYNPSNGFGTYEGFVSKVWEVFYACIKNRDATVEVCT